MMNVWLQLLQPLTYDLAFPSTTTPYPTCSSWDAGTNTYAVWFLFTPANDGHVHFLTCSSSLNTVMAIYTGLCAGLTQQACNDDTSGSCTGSAINLVVTTGTTYFVRIGGFG